MGIPRIVINPAVFEDKRDALCVAWNEAIRVVMESVGFEPKSEPTDAQRKFFSDTAYADDEVQLRRTILARIATFDTSVKDPTDDQLAETGSFLDAILESDWCKNDWERNCVSRLSEAVKASVGSEPVEPRQEPLEAKEPEPLQSRAALGGGGTDEDARTKTPVQEPVEPMEPDQQAEPRQDEQNGTQETVERMNGPAIEPTRQIVDLGSMALTDSKRMNGPAIEPTRQIGDLGNVDLTDAVQMNGQAIPPSSDAKLGLDKEDKRRNRGSSIT